MSRMANEYTVTLANTRLSSDQREQALARFRAKLEERLGSAADVCEAKRASDAALAAAPRVGNEALDRWLNAFSAAYFHARSDRFHELVEFRVQVPGHDHAPTPAIG